MKTQPPLLDVLRINATYWDIVSRLFEGNLMCLWTQQSDNHQPETFHSLCVVFFFFFFSFLVSPKIPGFLFFLWYASVSCVVFEMLFASDVYQTCLGLRLSLHRLVLVYQRPIHLALAERRAITAFVS